MNKIISLILITLSCKTSFGQTNFFTVVKLGNKYSEIQLSDAVHKADWCGYYHISERYQLNFDDGALIELKSMNEEFDNKNLLEVSCFQNENTKDLGVYKIHESGILIRMLSARNTSKN